jgi:hypothetical protein
MDLAELFPAGDFRFHLTLRRSPPADFFASRDPTGRLVAERRQWIRADPGRYVACRAAGQALLREFLALAGKWPGHEQHSGNQGMLEVGEEFEPDLLFLAPDAAGRFVLEGGALCFPTGWALEEKVGLTLDDIHAVVPGLNPALASPISQFLTRLKPGVAFLRDNWGLAATAELNLHPSRRLPGPTSPCSLDQLWLRVERQALLALSQSGGVVFGIRIELHRLDRLAGTVAGAGLARALETMPVELAAYKRIAEVRAAVAAELRQAETKKATRTGRL